MHDAPVSIPYTIPFETPSGNIKRIVIFSSTVAIGIFRSGLEYTEEEWNDDAINDVKKNGKASNGLVKYMASKTLAERGATTLLGALVPCAHLGNHISCLGVLQ